MSKYRDEKWFPLLGHEQMYKISDYGRLKQIRTSAGMPIEIIQKGIKFKRKGRKELIVNVVSPKTGRVNNVPFFTRFYILGNPIYVSKRSTQNTQVKCGNDDSSE